jgi:hypothetical protein
MPAITPPTTSTALLTAPVFHSRPTAITLFDLCLLFVVPAVYSSLIRVLRPSEAGGEFQMYMSTL